ncbi:hypothetical protein PR002_g13624 [Phytophthora rubi]|uniref:Uncharacterized protein n=1 Tax=Phytophthora rubi TaxID=129364 RepID=A0A6A3LAU5_9STRA|nr:hypothetical protein PR002_g13624 [Phytophthora rubi]
MVELTGGRLQRQHLGSSRPRSPTLARSSRLRLPRHLPLQVLVRLGPTVRVGGHSAKGGLQILVRERQHEPRVAVATHGSHAIAGTPRACRARRSITCSTKLTSTRLVVPKCAPIILSISPRLSRQASSFSPYLNDAALQILTQLQALLAARPDKVNGLEEEETEQTEDQQLQSEADKQTFTRSRPNCAVEAFYGTRTVLELTNEAWL